MKIAIVGAGKLGLRVTEILNDCGYLVTIIDQNEELNKRLSGSMDIVTVAGNAKDASLLEKIGVRDFDYFIITTDSDEKNIVIGSMAKKLGVSKVIARIRDPEYDNRYELLKEAFGIDYIANPERSIAEEISKYLMEKHSFQSGLMHAGRISMLEITVDKAPEIKGRQVSQVREEMSEKGMSLAAISKNGKLIILQACDDCVIEADDALYIVGERDHVNGAAAKFIDKERYTNIHRVMVAGGGKVGFYIARMLEEFNTSVKIIEIDKERCRYLSTHLQKALILNGDATDLSLLNDENFSEMDAFISATGFDEENLLLALMAKQEGIEDVIAKISRDSFGSLVTKMGVDMVLNPIDISANHIVRNIDDGGILSSRIIQGQAELALVAIARNMGVEGKSIGSLKMPPGLAIIALQRGQEVILPSNETKIMKGDRAVILCLLTESGKLEKLLRKR